MKYKELIINFFIKLILLGISVVLGAVFYKVIIKRCIESFILINLNGMKGFIIYNFFKLTTVMLIYLVFLMIFRRKIGVVLKFFIFGLYVGTMFLLLFARPKVQRGIILNPLNFMHGLDHVRNQLYLVGNVIFFIPIGYLLRKYKIWEAGLFALSIEFNIELFQNVFKRGVFDVSDIVVNMVGIMIGYIVSRIVMGFVKRYSSEK